MDSSCWAPAVAPCWIWVSMGSGTWEQLWLPAGSRVSMGSGTSQGHGRGQGQLWLPAREGSLQGLFPFSFLNICHQDPTECKTLL